MPQMAPIMWPMMFIMFTLVYIIMMMIMYFYNNYKMMETNNMKNMTKNKIWKW